jgi:anaerobic ribonucleoside-triphosphate reductase activating protein
MQSNDRLRVHDLAFGKCPLLGPCLYVWVQGCPRRCDRCFNEAALDQDGAARLMLPEEVAQRWKESDGGLVLSGGEPFSQARGLTRLCQLVRAFKPQAPILAYSGYYLDELIKGERQDWVDLLKQLDVLVDGPFIYDRRTDFPLTGSDNQRVLFLGSRVPRQRLDDLNRSQIQVSLRDDGQLRLMGTGSQQLDMHGLVELIKAAGVRLEE